MKFSLLKNVAMLLVSYSSHENQTAINDIENKDKTREPIIVSTIAVIHYFFSMGIFLKHLNKVDSKHIKMAGLQDFY